jgi:hypothetical protein
VTGQCGFVDEVGQLVGGQAVTAVDEHAGDGGHRNAEVLGDVARVEAAARVQADSGDRSVAARDEDLGAARRVAPEPSSAAADRWLSAAPSPAAKTAASHRPSRESAA